MEDPPGRFSVLSVCLDRDSVTFCPRARRDAPTEPLAVMADAHASRLQRPMPGGLPRPANPIWRCCVGRAVFGRRARVPAPLGLSDGAARAPCSPRSANVAMSVSGNGLTSGSAKTIVSRFDPHVRCSWRSGRACPPPHCAFTIPRAPSRNLLSVSSDQQVTRSVPPLRVSMPPTPGSPSPAKSPSL